MEFLTDDLVLLHGEHGFEKVPGFSFGEEDCGFVVVFEFPVGVGRMGDRGFVPDEDLVIGSVSTFDEKVEYSPANKVFSGAEHPAE